MTPVFTIYVFMLKKAPKGAFYFKGVMPMKRVLVLICALMLIVGYAVSESQVSPEETTEIVETIEEPIVETVEEAPPEEVLETFSEQPPEEPVVEEVVEEPVVEESVTEEPIVIEEPVVEEPTVKIIEENPTVEETPVVEEPVEKVEEEPVVETPIIEEPTEEPVPVEEVIEATITPEEEPSDDVASGAIEFEEDDWGEITIEFKREVYISFLREPKHIGDTVTLVATLVNFKPDDQYIIAWQYSIDGEEWISIEGEDERTYTFILDEVNCQYSYRALVELEE